LRRRQSPKKNTAIEPSPTASPRTAFALGGNLSAASSPNILASGTLFAEVLAERNTLLSPALRLGLLRSLTAEKHTASGAAALTFTLARLEACPVRFEPAMAVELRPCLVAEAGALDAEGKNVVNTRQVRRLWATGGAALRAAVRAGRWWMELEVGGVAPFTRDSFYFSPTQAIYTPPTLLAQASLGIALRWR